jgi:uncharacterized protein (DUF433 family)
MPPEIINSHIRVDDKGVAWIEATRVKVIEVVMDKLAWGWSPEEMHYQHPHLSLAQIHGALAYYYDHKDELEADIERRLREAEHIRAATENKDLQARLRAAKRKA